ncbi:CAP domain-containing protein [Streptomyces sp. NPDC001832]|uniref:CAP domain-containing protein n=1 Tax=Streptomyces sp. NPDC001832 TaxID=3154527 RepID=UPI00331F9A02
MIEHHVKTDRRRMAIVVVALGAVGTTGAMEIAGAASVPSATASAVFSPHEKEAARLLKLVNRARSAAGCSPLKANAKLAKAARKHSADMASHRNMSHTGSDGSDPGDRIKHAGYDRNAYGENVARGYTTPESVMAGWMSSPDHKRNILDCSFKEIGVGLAQPGNYWTQDFGQPDRQSAR